MAIPTTEDQQRNAEKFAAVLQTKPRSAAAEAPQQRRRRVPRWLVMSVVAATVVTLGVAAAMKTKLLAPDAGGRQVLTEKVHRADLIVSITEDGNVESSQNIDVKCEVKGGSTILWIIKDGTQVKKGEELVRLDSSVIEDQVNAQKILFEKAKAAMIDAEKLYESAKIAVQEYKEGVYLQSLQDLEAKAFVAKENLESARNSLQHTVKMHRKGYVTDLQRDAQAFAVQRSELDLKVAQTARDVLEKFTRAKTLVGLESARDSAEAKMASERAAFDLEQARLERLQEQLDKCVILAPDDGMVVYANDSEASRRGNSQTAMVEEGSLMRERQNILRLPDLNQMQVKCTVHESKVDSLQRGMRARIRIQDRDYQGTVTSVSSQAEPSNWFSGTVKEYGTVVSIDSDPQGLRPGMTAAVEILVAHMQNVLSVPVQAVVERGGKFYCWVSGATGYEKRPVILGVSNNTRIEIKDGLAEGDTVLLNPRAVVEEARQDVREEETVDVGKKFGGSQAKSMPNIGGAPPAGGNEDGGGAGAGKQKGGRGNVDLMSFDKDGDKKVSKDEAPEQMKNFFDRIDSNSDGFIDVKEAAEAKRRAQQRQQGGGEGPGGGASKGGAEKGGAAAGGQ